MESASQKILELMSEFGMQADNHDRQTIDKILKGWSSIRPITVETQADPLSVAGTARMHLVEEHHYTEKVGSKSCSGSKCHETFPGVDQDFTNFQIHRVDVTASGVKVSGKTANFDVTSLKEALASDEKYGEKKGNLGQFLKIESCEKAVKTLTESIYGTLESFGLITNSDIKDQQMQEAFKARLSAILAEAERKRRMSEFVTLRFQIPLDMWKVMKDCRRDDDKALNWLYADGNEEVQKYRIQAAQSYPLFLPVFLKEHRSDFDPFKDRYRRSYYREKSEEESAHEESQRAEYQAFVEQNDQLLANIDEAKPIADQLRTSLLSDFEVSPRTLRSLGKIKKMPDGMNYKTFLLNIKHLDSLDSSWHPRTTDELADFMECVVRAEAFEKVLDRPVMETLLKTKGKWTEWKEKTVSEQAILHIRDWRTEVTRMVILPLILKQVPKDVLETITDRNKFMEATGQRGGRGGFGLMWDFDMGDRIADQMKRIFETEEKEAISAFFSKVSDLEMLACSIRWHEQGETYSARKQALGISNLSDLDNWAALSEPVQSPHGYWIKPLTSKAALNEEGAAMGHCVGWNGYDAKCLTKRDHIVSVSEDGGDARLSTVQLREVFNELGQVVNLEIAQNQGPGKDKGTQAVEWYIKELFNNPSMRPDWKAIEEIRADNRNVVMKEGVAAQIGFDPMEDGNPERAYETVRAYLPAKYRQMSLDEFLNNSSAAELLKLEETAFGKALLRWKLITEEEPEQAIEEQAAPEPAPTSPSQERGRGLWSRIFGA